MAHFTDQFRRHNPWKFRPSILIPTWPTILLQDARELLSGVDPDALGEIAEEIEKELQAISTPYLFPMNRDHWIWTRVRREWVDETTTKTSDAIREGFGDLNLFLALHSEMNFRHESLLTFQVQMWELLAVIAIWKLIDSYDMLRSDANQPLAGPLQRFSNDAIGKSAALAMEAQAAVAHAVQIKQRDQYLKEIDKIHRAFEAASRSKKGKDAVSVRHQKLDAVRLAVFAFADKGQFESLAAAADAIANDIEISPGKCVPYLTAYRWLLKREVWEKKISARSK